MNCPVCQETIQADWYFCRWCGAALAVSTTPIVADTSQSDAMINLLSEALAGIGASAQQSAEFQAEVDLKATWAGDEALNNW